MINRTRFSSLLAAAGAIFATASPVLASTDIDLFAQLVIVTPSERGKFQSTPQGASFVDEGGWYVAAFPAGTTTTTRPPARDFALSVAGRRSDCTALPFPNQVHALYTFSNLQKRAETLLTVGGQWDKAAGSMMTVSDRSVMTIGGTSIRAAVFAGANTQAPGYRALAVVETTKGTLLVGCTGATIADSKALTARTFRLANGAMAGQ